MIMLTYWKKKAPLDYDILAFTSLSVPARCTQPGIQHWKDLAASQELGDLWGKMPEEEWGERYYQELMTDKNARLLELVKLSDSGKWIQILFFEESPKEGERPWLYKALKQYTEEVYIE